MSVDSAFVDTNILLYIYNGDLQKQKKAYSVLRDHECYISIQVVMEFCSVCTRKMKLSEDAVRRALSDIHRHCAIQSVTSATVRRALDVRERYGYSFYDSVMIASALELGCNYLFSEDMRHRHKIDKTVIFNIFAE